MGEREKRLASVRARLDRVASTGDLSPVLASAAVTEARQLTEIADDGDLQAFSALGWFHWYRCQALPAGQQDRDRQAAIRMLTPCFIAGADDLPQPLLPVLARQAVPDATAMGRRLANSVDQAPFSATVNLWRRILSALPADDPDRPGFLTNLATVLLNRFGRSGVSADLDAAVEAAQAAVDATPPGGRSRPLFLSNLGTMLRTRFEQTGTLADLDAAVQAGQAAVAATPAVSAGRPMYLASLGSSLQRRFEQTGVQADLDAAIDVTRAAVNAIPPGHPDRRGYLSDLSLVLRLQSGRTGALADLEAAVEAAQAAVDATPSDHPGRPMFLSNLGTARELRFRRTGALADLDAAVEAAQAAVDATPAGHAGRRAYLANLATTLSSRFERTGALADLDAAVEAAQAAVSATPAGHPDRQGLLSNLVIMLRLRADRTGTLADLDAATEAAQAAVDATPPGHPGRPMFLSNLRTARELRFRRTGALADLDAATKSAQAAVDATPSGHPDLAARLADLAALPQDRLERTGAPAGLDAAIEAAQAAVDATPPGHPDLAARLADLGALRRDRFGRTSAQADWDAALSMYARAAEVDQAPPSDRILAARSAALLAAYSEPAQAGSLLQAAVRLLPQVTPRQLERGDQEYEIGRFAGLAGEAATLALADPGITSGERAASALGLLEAGRAVLLSQALDTRSDLTDLRHQHPNLAERFAELRGRLDQPSGAAQPQRAAQDRNRLAGELAAVLGQIRSLDGFTSFGLPPSTDELLTEAAAGPTVTFNISRYGSDALLLTADGITSLPLTGITQYTLIGQINVFRRALRTGTDPGASSPERMAAQKQLLKTLEWLWDNAAEPVLDALGYGQSPPPGAPWPRVWWAPGGLLGLLPFHAAGHHTEPPVRDQERRSVMDRVVSSYTPTIRALRYARQHARRAATLGTGGRTLIVAMPVTPGLPGGGALPYVPAEAARVRALVPDPVLLADPGTQANGSSGIPTRANVLIQLPECAIAHFACHGASDPVDPSRSLLLLQDNDSEPLTVASLGPVNLDRAQLAYLSACSTAYTPAVQLTDEAIHLTTAFQLAGFSHVIGTLWEINDELAADVAGAFYSTLRSGPHTLDFSQAAWSLHQVVRALRDKYPNAPFLWAAYLHAGS